MGLNTVRGACLVGIAALIAGVASVTHIKSSTAAEAEARAKANWPYYESFQNVAYDAPGANGTVTKSHTTRYLKVTENPSGTCTRDERISVSFVPAGSGFLPEYKETRKVITCPQRDTPEYVRFIKQLRAEFGAGTVAGLPSKKT